MLVIFDLKMLLLPHELSDCVRAILATQKSRKLQLSSDAVNVHCRLLSQYGTADAEKTQKFLRMSRLKFNALNVHCPSSQTPVMLQR